MENLQQSFDVSQRRACVVLDQPRSSQRYVSEVRTDEAGLVTRMLQLSRERPRFGYRRIHDLLRSAQKMGITNGSIACTAKPSWR